MSPNPPQGYPPQAPYGSPPSPPGYPPPPGAPPPGPYTAPPGFAPPPAVGVAGALGMLQQALAARAKTDEIMSGLWVALILLTPLISIIVVVMGFMVLGPFMMAIGFFPFIILAILIPAVIVFIFFYKQLQRMAGHFDREAMVRRSIIEYLRARSAQDGRGGWIATEVATMEAISADAAARDQKQSGALALLAFIPIAKWYLLYLVTKWPSEHDQRWSAFAAQASAAASKLGIVVVGVSWNPVPRRSFAVYLVLTLITGGLFAIYWYYVLCKDPNEHFQTHVRVEDAFAAALR